MPRPDGMEPPSTPVCSNGVPGVEGSGEAGTACCPLTCLNTSGQPQCGGSLCGQREGGAKNCCVQGVNKFQKDCKDTGAAPCKNGELLTQSSSGDCSSWVPRKVGEQISVSEIQDSSPPSEYWRSGASPWTGNLVAQHNPDDRKQPS